MYCNSVTLMPTAHGDWVEGMEIFRWSYMTEARIWAFFLFSLCEQTSINCSACSKSEMEIWIKPSYRGWAHLHHFSSSGQPSVFFFEGPLNKLHTAKHLCSFNLAPLILALGRSCCSRCCAEWLWGGGGWRPGWCWSHPWSLPEASPPQQSNCLQCKYRLFPTPLFKKKKSLHCHYFNSSVFHWYYSMLISTPLISPTSAPVHSCRSYLFVSDVPLGVLLCIS